MDEQKDSGKIFSDIKKIYSKMTTADNHCHENCSKCCIPKVKVTWIEFRYLISELSNVEIKMLSDKIRKNNRKMCILLEDGECIAYEKRPWICRNYQRYPDEDKCLTANTKRGEITDNFLLSFDITRLNNFHAPDEFKREEKTIEEWFLGEI